MRSNGTGGFYSKPSLCIPIAARDSEDLDRQIEYVRVISPDFVEFRGDYYPKDGCIEALKQIATELSGIPVIFTFRKKDEGGICELEESERKEIILSAISSGYASILDIEESTKSDDLRDVIDVSRKEGVLVMMSFHDMRTIPPGDIIKEKIENMSRMGADIIKIAVTPRNKKAAFDFIEIMRGIKQITDIPVVIVTMGQHGLFLRLFGWVLESPIVYAAGLVRTAPGQPPAQYVKWLIDSKPSYKF